MRKSDSNKVMLGNNAELNNYSPQASRRVHVDPTLIRCGEWKWWVGHLDAQSTQVNEHTRYFNLQNKWRLENMRMKTCLLGGNYFI